MSRVSEDLRDPLTIVQGLAQTLGRHGERLEPERREELLDRLTHQAQSLGATLETLLDFSRLQREHAQADLVDIDVVALLAPVLVGLEAAFDVRERTTVRVDVGLVRRAIELLRRSAAGSTTTVRFERVGDEAVVDIRTDGPVDGGLLRAVAEQLLALAGGRCRWEPDGLSLALPLAVPFAVPFAGPPSGVSDVHPGEPTA